MERANVQGIVSDSPHIETAVPLAPLTRLRIGGPAASYCRPESVPELLAALDWAHERLLPVTILGAGSNVLIDDEGLPGLTVNVRKLTAITRVGEESIRAECGCFLPRLARYAQDAGRAGWEFMSVIPGTLGASCRINAGLGTGEQMADWIVEVRGFNHQRGMRVFDISGLAYGYRSSRLLDDPDVVVIDCLLRLGPPADAAGIARKTLELVERRRRRFPTRHETCGSVFRAAPDGTPAGKLLDEAGVKGFRVGDCQVAWEHANWILNVGSATARDVRAVIATMQDRVRARTGIELRREVFYLPQDRSRKIEAGRESG